jgi:hypothetical protein
MLPRRQFLCFAAAAAAIADAMITLDTVSPLIAAGHFRHAAATLILPPLLLRQSAILLRHAAAIMPPMMPLTPCLLLCCHAMLPPCAADVFAELPLPLRHAAIAFAIFVLMSADAYITAAYFSLMSPSRHYAFR